MLLLGVFLSICLLVRVMSFDVSSVFPPIIPKDAANVLPLHRTNDVSAEVPLIVSNDATLTKATTAATKSEEQAEAPISAIVHQPPLVPGVRGQPCRYDGHCGVGMTCAIDKLLTTMGGNSGPGSCQPFPLSKTPTTLEKSPCALRCLEGLPEESILQQVWLSKAEQNIMRPDACVLTFRLEPGYKRSEYDDNKYNDVIKDHRIVRRDPVLNSTYSESEVIATGAGSTSNGGGTLGQILWMAICYEPCDGSCVEGFVCKDRVCRRDESYWKTSDSEMVIVTGANDEYFRALQNLVGSLRYWAPENRIAVYNLGLSEKNWKTVETWDNVFDVKWKTGRPTNYPEHLEVSYAYAWKPVAINESLHEYKQIFWLDAGSTVVGPITEAIRITQETGAFLVWGQDSDMTPKSHEKMYEAFGYRKKAFRGGPSYSGNTQAYLYPSRYVDTVVIPSAQCALLKDCIMPPGSNLWNHRYDQSALSVLCHREDLKIPQYTLYLAAERSQLASSLKEPSQKFIWTSRGSCSEFANRVVVKGSRMAEWLSLSLGQLFRRDDN